MNWHFINSGYLPFMGISLKMYFYPNIFNTINSIELFLMTKIIWVAMNLYNTASCLFL